MSALDTLLDDLLDREGGWRDAVVRPDGSVDPPTNRGITLPTLAAWRNRHRPPDAYRAVTEDDLRALTAEEARLIYHQRYIIDPAFLPDVVPYEPLREQLIDFGVHSGPPRAIRYLQRVLRLVYPSLEVSGRLDSATTAALSRIPVVYFPWLHEALITARCAMMDRAVDQGLLRKADEEGIESRALSFTRITI